MECFLQKNIKLIICFLCMINYRHDIQKLLSDYSVVVSYQGGNSVGYDNYLTHVLSTFSYIKHAFSFKSPTSTNAQDIYVHVCYILKLRHNRKA